MMKDSVLNELQDTLLAFARERDWEQFHSPKNLVMALSVEASELLEHFQWMTEAQSESLSDSKRTEVGHEMADIFIYLLRLSERLDINVLDMVEEKIKINHEKYPADKVRGSSKKYNEY
jgi:NTP pyrophosphatase (non-canonical NTP hydrolase)